MWNVPKGGLIGKTVHFFRHIASLRVPLYAANACYFMVLALFPALLLLFSLLHYTPLDVERVMQLLSGILPAAFLEGAEELILTTYDASASRVLGISALTALWSASRGIYGVLIGLNAIYQVSENRGYFRTRLISTLYTLIFLVVLLLTLALHVFAGDLLTFLEAASHPFLQFLLGIIDFRFFLLLFLQTAVFCLMFMFLPSRNNGFRESIPGSLLASCGWLIFANLFSVYVEHFGSVSVYGPISALALGLLWLYCCMSIVFYGAVLNVILKNWK